MTATVTQGCHLASALTITAAVVGVLSVGMTVAADRLQPDRLQLSGALKDAPDVLQESLESEPAPEDPYGFCYVPDPNNREELQKKALICAGASQIGKIMIVNFDLDPQDAEATAEGVKEELKRTSRSTITADVETVEASAGAKSLSRESCSDRGLCERGY